MPNPTKKLDHLFWEDLEARVADEAASIRKAVRPRGWAAAGVHLSAVPDVAYPFDPAVVAAIRSFDPNTIPLFITRRFKAPTGEIRVYRYHVLSSHRWNPDQRPADAMRTILMPTWGNAPAPTHIDLHLEDRRQRSGNGLPGGYIPFDWRVYHALRSSFQEWSAKEKVRFIEQNDRAAVARRARIAAEARVDARIKRDRDKIRGHLANIDKRDAERLIEQWLKKPAPMVTVPAGISSAA